MYPDTGAPSDVVDGRERMVLAAPFERDLELARERRAQRMPQQEAREGLGVGGDVEHLVRSDAGIRAGGDVAHRVAARFARRKARVGEVPHRGWNVVECDEVELEVLARRDVTEASGVLLGHVGEGVELRRV